MPDGFLGDAWINYMMAHYSIVAGWVSKLIIPLFPIILVKFAAILHPGVTNNGMVEFLQIAFGHKVDVPRTRGDEPVGDELSSAVEPTKKA